MWRGFLQDLSAVWLLVPALIQAVVMLVDELWFHRRRGLPAWERIGHPMDTLSVAAFYAFVVARPPSSPHALGIAVALAAFSCLFVTKDEFVHARACAPAETWLHALLFVLHPIVFFALGLLWWSGEHTWVLKVQLAVTLAFAVYQFAYWSVPWNRDKALASRSTTASTRS